MEYWQLQQRKSLPLEAKIIHSEKIIREWYEKNDGNVYVSFSGGLDSTVLAHLVCSIYKDVPLVFSDTGLEYPELKDHVNNFDKEIEKRFGFKPIIKTVRPVKSFKQVIEEEGYPVVSKKVSRSIRDLKNPTEKNKNIRNLYLTGKNMKGEECKSFKLAKKWVKLIEAPFKISEKCCDITKKQPIKMYEKESRRKPYIGITTEESKTRESTYLQRGGCNSYSKTSEASWAIAIWTKQDVLQYVINNNVKIASVYGNVIKNDQGLLDTTGEKRTGCMFCAFGAHLEKGENRFERMSKTHPKIHSYCMNELGMKEVLEYVGVKTGLDK